MVTETTLLLRGKEPPGRANLRVLSITIAVFLSFTAFVCILRPLVLAPMLFLSRGVADDKKDTIIIDVPDSKTAKTVQVVVTQDKMIESEVMQRYIRDLNLTTHQFLRQNYLPQNITIEYDQDLIQGKVGADAFSLGKVAFSMQHCNDSGFLDRVYNMVVSLNGTIASMSPQLLHLGSGYRPKALKMYNKDPSYVLLSMISGDQSFSGPLYLWDWERDRYTNLSHLSARYDAHDIQVAPKDESGCIFWATADFSTGSGIAMYNSKGTTAGCPAFEENRLSGDLNHVQVIRNSSTAIISDRGASAIVVLNISGNSSIVDYILGGKHSNVDLVDEYGLVYTAGTKELWKGQHNAEYFGNNEFYMYDNHYSAKKPRDTNNSRGLIVKFDENESKASVIWKYDMGFHTEVYGDCDRVANNNIQVTGWVYTYESGAEFDFCIREITRHSMKTAWELKVFNQDKSEKPELSYAGWQTYSAERVYDRALIYGINCTVSSHQHVDIFFWALNRIKENEHSYGDLVVHDESGAEIANRTIVFLPFFEPSPIKVTVHGSSCDGNYITVRNRWGDITKKYL